MAAVALLQGIPLSVVRCAGYVIVVLALVLRLAGQITLAQTDLSLDWFNSLHVVDAHTGWALSVHERGGVIAKGGIESVVRTTDGGIHWRNVTPIVPAGMNVGAVPVYLLTVLNGSTAWVSTWLEDVTPSGERRTSDSALTFRTRDGGMTWTSTRIPAPLMGPMSFVNARDGWILPSQATRWGPSVNDVYHTTDGGVTWAKVGSVGRPLWIASGSIPHVTFLNTATGWLTGTRTQHGWFASKLSDILPLYTTRDGGATWQRRTLPLPHDVRPDQFTFSGFPPKFFTAQYGVLAAMYIIEDASQHLASGEGVLIYVTRDGGTTWQYTARPFLPTLHPQYAPGLFVQNYWDSSFADVDHGWVTDGNELYATTDSGHHWTALHPGPPFATIAELDFISPTVGWAAGQGNSLPLLLQTKNGGRTWTSLPHTISR